MKKKKQNKSTKGKSLHKSKKAKEIEIEPEKIIIPKRPKIIREKKELFHENPCQGNEGIVKSIIDKLITLSLRKSYLNTINKLLENYYFDYMKTQISTLFAENNIFYYDEPENEQIEKKELFWNKKYEKGNTWIEISEPNTSKCDRYENAFMNYLCYNLNSSSSKLPSPNLNRANTLDPIDKKNVVDLKEGKLRRNFTINALSSKKKKDNSPQILDTLEEKSSLSSFEEESKDINNANKKANRKISIKKKSIRKISPKKEKNHSQFQNTNNSKINTTTTNNNNPINKRPKKEPIPEMNHKEIPGIEKDYNHDKYDPPEVNFLRKEKLEEIIKKEIEERKNAKNKKLVNNSQNENNDNFNEINTKIKMFDSNKFSFDSNGKIINFKPIKMDALIKDFVSLKNEIKSFDSITKAKKFIKKIKNLSSKKSGDSSNKNKTIVKEKIIKNPEDDPNGINRHNYVKLNLDKNEQIIPSGSNFSIMLPNIGVILKEDEQIKQGTREFGKYFKKYSLNDYNKILREFVPLQNKTMLKNKMNQSMNNMSMTTSKVLSKKFLNNTNINNSTYGNNLLLSTQTHNYTQINNIFNSPDISNPLINQGDNIQENDSIINNNLYNNYNINNEFNINSINNSSLLKTFKSNKNQSYNNSALYSTPFSFKRNGSIENLTGIIKLNKNGSSLKDELNSLKDLDDKDDLKYFPIPDKNELNSRNIFISNYKDLFRQKKKQTSTNNNLNEFNKKILTSKGWGTKTMSKNMSTGNLLFSKHQTRYQALKELGSNLLNGIKVKLPRERKVDVRI